ncbi:hypothetical protein [Pseudomonas yamanorum]|jgi:hypothetical protein|uniref:hypothetical protein n=1 Tax=Pseudomonas yamanorum TaxID=515393 RepID=UPI003BA39B89
MSSAFEMGKSITEAVRFVSIVGAECDHLANMIREELSRMLLLPEVAGRYKAAGKWLTHYQTDAKDWVYVDFGSSLPVIVKPKRSVGGYLVFQISLSDLGIAAQGNQEPLLHVGWWTDPVDLEELKMGFPLHVDTEFDVVLEDERLFCWVKPHVENEWCYSVRLTDINNPTDVQNQIIQPMKALLLRQPASEAFKNTTVVRYAKVEEAGQYRILPR